jgi:hypothetical protein
LGYIFAGVLCFAFWPSVIYGQTEASPTEDPCGNLNIRTDVRPDEEGPPTEVSVGVLMADLTDINDVTQTLTGDFVVIEAWKDARLSHLEGCEVLLDDIWSPDLVFVNSGRLISSLSREVDIGPGGQVTYTQRYYGTLASYHSLEKFPFDHQKIKITLIPLEWSEEDVKLVVDQGVTGRRDQINISDWNIDFVVGAIDRFYADAFDRYHSSFVLEITANRITAYYTWKIIIPLCLIVAMSWAVFWINPAQFGPQIGLSATSMLTLIAFIFATTNMVPKIGYFTILDYFIGGSTILVFLAFLQSLTTSYLVSQNRAEVATRIDRICRIVFPLIFAALVGVVLIPNVIDGATSVDFT